MTEITPCAPEVKMRRVAHIGARWQFECPCGARSPLASKEVAELAYLDHVGEKP